jgi:hypothetical protein
MPHLLRKWAPERSPPSASTVIFCCPDEPVLNSDETGYRTNGEKRWLWAMVAPGFVFYKIALTRGAEVLVQLLGEVFAGILCSDLTDAANQLLAVL